MVQYDSMQQEWVMSKALQHGVGTCKGAGSGGAEGAVAPPKKIFGGAKRVFAPLMCPPYL